MGGEFPLSIRDDVSFGASTGSSSRSALPRSRDSVNVAFSPNVHRLTARNPDQVPRGRPAYASALGPDCSDVLPSLSVDVATTDSSGTSFTATALMVIVLLPTA